MDLKVLGSWTEVHQHCEWHMWINTGYLQTPAPTEEKTMESRPSEGVCGPLLSGGATKVTSAAQLLWPTVSMYGWCRHSQRGYRVLCGPPWASPALIPPEALFPNQNLKHNKCG